VAATLDCEVLGDLYGTPELRAVFDSRALVQAWLDVERALAEAQAEVGVIPAAAAVRIAAEADAARFDLEVLRQGVATSNHPLVPLVRALAERCGEDGGWVHWGATTQDIVDTALVLLARRAIDPIERDLARGLRAAAALAARYSDTPMAGRTHAQHAVPITFGLKAASWGDELGRAAERLRRACESASTAQLAGAAGTLAALGRDAVAVQEAFCRRLGLAPADVHWHAARDRLRDLAHALSEIGAAAERICAEIVRLQSTEIAEVAEPATEAHVGSSTMPQKRNPMTCEYVIASARLLRGSTSVLVDSPAHAYERDMGYWAAEWVALPQALILAGGIVDKLASVLEGLEVYGERMRANLELTRGQIMAEAVMMELGRAIGHERAHALVLAASRRATDEGRSFVEVLRADPDVAGLVSAGELERLLDPVRYLGLATASAVAVAGRLGAAR
jgi:adenylosuccinate lyase/3-carboxy-cis,cis-muconate cycloisomerase